MLLEDARVAPDAACKSANPTVHAQIVNQQKDLVHLVLILGLKQHIVDDATNGAHPKAIPDDCNQIRILVGVVVLVEMPLKIQFVGQLQEVVETNPKFLPYQTIAVVCVGLPLGIVKAGVVLKNV